MRANKTYIGNSIFLEKISPLNCRHKKLVDRFFPDADLESADCLFSHLFRSYLNDYFVFDKATKKFLGFVRFYPFLDLFGTCEVAFFVNETPYIQDIVRVIKKLPIINREHITQGSFHPFNSKESILNPFCKYPVGKICQGFQCQVDIDNKNLIEALYAEGFSLSFMTASKIIAYYRDIKTFS